MRYAFIESNVVMEVVRVNPFSIFHEEYASKFIEVDENVEVGWVKVDGQLVAPIVEKEKPSSCTRRQGRLALLQYGLLDDVETIIDSIQDPIEKRTAQIEYEADTWEKSNPLLQKMWEAVGGTQSSLDDLFTLAIEF